MLRFAHINQDLQTESSMVVLSCDIRRFILGDRGTRGRGVRMPEMIKKRKTNHKEVIVSLWNSEYSQQ